MSEPAALSMLCNLVDTEFAGASAAIHAPPQHLLEFAVCQHVPRDVLAASDAMMKASCTWHLFSYLPIFSVINTQEIDGIP